MNYMHQYATDAAAAEPGAPPARPSAAARPAAPVRPSRRPSRARRAGPVSLAASALLLWPVAPAKSEDQPSDAMLATAGNLARFMSELPVRRADRLFAARGVCIVENFVPFLFCGSRAVLRWEAGFRAHAAAEALSGIEAHFGPAFDFSESRGRAYFSLPTTWTGFTHGRRFEEHGAWAFVLERPGAGWRIKGYGWGVTGYTEAPVQGP